MSTEEAGFAPDPEAELDLGLPHRQELALDYAKVIKGALEFAVVNAPDENRAREYYLAQCALSAGEITVAAAEPPAADESLLPAGAFGRIDLPGYRNHTGWVTEETRFGVVLAVVRDWEGRVLAEVAMGPGCQFVHLPTPLRRPEEQERAAITAGDPWGHGDDDEDSRGLF